MENFEVDLSVHSTISLFETIFQFFMIDLWLACYMVSPNQKKKIFIGKMPENDAEQIKKEQRRAVYHGGVNLALGLLAGVPYTLIILRDYHKDWSIAEQAALSRPDNSLLFKLAKNFTGTERAWRMAHLEGLLNGMFCLIVASVFPALKLSREDLHSLVDSLALTAYGNSIASSLAALYGVRGFVFAGSIQNMSSFSLYVAAIYGVARSVQLILRGSSSE